MYKHMLVPTDGSPLSLKAIRTATRLAKLIGGRITGIYVIPPYTPPVYGEAVMYVSEVSPKRYKEISEREAKQALEAVKTEAHAAGVPSKVIFVTAQNPWEGIIRGAKAKKCDLIVMASHGRKGLSGLLLGSETTKVLTHSKVPVLVCR